MGNNNNLKINVCSIETPTDPNVWSRTPYNILSALKIEGCDGLAFSTERGNRIERFFKKAESRFYKLPIHWERRGRFLRGYRAWTSSVITKGSGSNITLHFSTSSLPFFIKPRKQKHYLFIDSTWNLWSTQSSLNKSYSPRVLKMSENLEKKSFQQVEHIFSISQYVKENLVNHYGIDSSKITVVGTGTGIIQPFFGKKDLSDPRLLFVAKARFEDKGGFVLLEAFEKLLLKIPQAKLTMVGQSNYRKIIHPNITSYGKVSLQQLQELFITHAVYVMPSINEPWGLVYIEAMLCKMPIVGININSFPELSNYGQNGVGINSPDADQLCDVLYNLMVNIELIEKMGLAGQEFALGTFNWEKTVRAIISMIRSQNQQTAL